jgi:hypothetical protein
MPRNDPEFVKPFFHADKSRHRIARVLQDEPVGAFCFFPGWRTSRAPVTGEARTREWALFHANGNADLAREMLDVEAEDRIGFAIRTAAGCTIDQFDVVAVARLGSLPRFVAVMQSAREIREIDVTRAVRAYDPYAFVEC